MTRRVILDSVVHENDLLTVCQLLERAKEKISELCSLSLKVEMFKTERVSLRIIAAVDSGGRVKTCGAMSSAESISELKRKLPVAARLLENHLENEISGLLS